MADVGLAKYMEYVLSCENGLKLSLCLRSPAFLKQDVETAECTASLICKKKKNHENNFLQWEAGMRRVSKLPKKNLEVKCEQ